MSYKEKIVNFIKSNKILLTWALLVLLLVFIWWIYWYTNKFKLNTNVKDNVVATNDIRPISLTFDKDWNSLNYWYLSLENSLSKDVILNSTYCTVTNQNPNCYSQVDTNIASNYLSNHPELLTWKDYVYIYSTDLFLKDNIDKLILTYSGDLKFDVLSWSNYTNSWNKIIFENKPLFLQAKNNIKFLSSTINSWDFILIPKTFILPKFNSLKFDYSYNWKIVSYDYDLTKDIVNFAQIVWNNTWDILYQIVDRVGLNSTLTVKWYNRLAQDNWKVSLDASSGTVLSGNITHSISWDDLLISFNNLWKDTEYKLIFSNWLTNYIVKFTTIWTFKVVSQINHSTHPLGSDYDLNYHVCFNQPLDENQTRKVFESALWSWNISLVFSNNDSEYLALTWRQYCAMFYYYINPTIDNKFSLTWVQSIFWESVNFDVNIPKHEIPEKYKFATVNWNLMNLLPKKWFWWDKIQIWYKNMTWATLNIRSCTFKDPSKISWSLEFSSWDTYWWYQEIIYKLLDCQTTKSVALNFSWFEWWKNKVLDRNIKDLFGSVPSIFETSFLDLNENPGKIFFVSNIGILVKFANWNVHIWTNQLDTWKPLDKVDLQIGYLTWKELKVINLPNSTWYAYYKIPTLEYGSFSYVIAKTQDDQSMVVFPDINVYYSTTWWSYNYFNNWFYTDISQLWFQSSGYERLTNYRVYGYTDRALYKAWDEINYSGWVRKPWSTILWTWSIVVSLKDPNYVDLYTTTLTGFDAFGWFSWSFTLPAWAKLWSYSLTFTYSDQLWNSNTYYSYITVEEFKKSTFFIDKTYVLDNNNSKYIRIYPKYYFGSDLKNFNVTMDYTLRGEHYGVWDWSWCGSEYCQEPYYYSRAWWSDEYSWWVLYITWYWKNYFDIPFNFNPKYIANFDMDLKITDQDSSEVLNKNISESVYPNYIVWFKWWDYDWMTNKDTNYKIVWNVMKLKTTDLEWLKNYEKLSGWKIKIITYFKDYNWTEEKGPDWEWYYAWTDYKKMDEKEIDINNDWSFNYDIKTDKPGAYFVRAVYQNDYEVQKTINVYSSDNYSYSKVYGEMTNNFKLNVHTKDKNYDEGEELSVFIEPYIKWAYAVINVEQEDKILENKIVQLDWSEIKLKVNKDWYPNAYISVSMMVGEDVNKTLSENRQEPRWLMWYSSISLSPNLMKLKYNVSITDQNWNAKQFYQPWEKVKLFINVTDSKNNPVQTRLSVAVVDKALLDIYDEIKTPLENFYSAAIDSFQVSTNMKLLYKALKVFSTDWTKWWDWAPWSSNSWVSLFQPRKRFLDVAYWNGWVVTNEKWDLVLDVTLPDNLTTWVVETLWITKDLKLGSNRYFFKTSKDVIVKPNLPNFITFGDKISIPVQVVKNTDVKFDLKWYIKLWETKKDLIIKDNSFEINLNDFDMDSIVNNSYLTVYLAALNWNNAFDEVEYQLPLRKEWFFINWLTSIKDKIFSWTINLSSTAKFLNANITVSTIPVDAFNKAFKYLLHYPYGCTEQLLSWLYPIVISKDLASKWFISHQIVSWDNINIDWNIREIKKVVADTMTIISKNQKADWLFGYWPDNSESSNLYLSIYVYNVLKYLEKSWYTQEVDFSVLSKLEKSLLNISDKNMNLYFLMQKSVLWEKVEKRLITESISNISSNTWLANNIFAYVALAYLWERNTKLENTILNSSIDKISSNDYYEFNLNPYINKNILKALFAKWLVKNWQLEKAKQIVFDFNKSRDSNWVWWWSTQENLQILLTMWDYFKSVNIDKKSLPYSLSINNNNFTWTIDQSNIFKTYTLKLSNLNSLNVNYSSDWELLVDINYEYLPENLEDMKNEIKNVSDLSFEYWGKSKLENAKIWDVITWTTSFKVDKDVSNLAVVYTIPSNYFILNPNLSQTKYSYFNFQNNSNTNTWYDCWPTHYEVKFDQLFLYYSNLPAGAWCKVDIQMMKTHNAQINTTPIKLWEMYWWEVYATKYIK